MCLLHAQSPHPIQPPLNTQNHAKELQMTIPEIQNLIDQVDQSIRLTDSSVEVVNLPRLRETIYQWVEASSLGSAREQAAARYLVRKTALALDLVSSSIHDLYLARGRGELPHTFTTPAMNLRALPFVAARAVFRVAKAMDAGAFIFEIARSEMGYTDQRPSEYTTNVLAAAIAEGFTGPVFIQGDHFQVSAKRYASDPEAELQAVRDLTREAIQAGFYNIDVDTSTLVDLSKATTPEQQALNSQLSAMYTAFIRELEPEGVTISVGGEIGEVGGQNSNEEELRAYMDGYNEELAKQAPGAIGLSKISIQTGTSHGGVVLPDGSIAQVSVDFDTLLNLSRIAREAYHLGGAVQHGASTLPENAFGKFVEAEAIEVHLATNFQNILFDRIPAGLRDEMYAFLDKKYASEKKPNQTAEQFYYKTRKNAIGPFKAALMHLDAPAMEAVSQAWEAQFHKLFTLLGAADTAKYVAKTIKPVKVQPHLKDYLAADAVEEDVSDLAD
jgi:fructose/tagatose bisphosphate aldolase